MEVASPEMILPHTEWGDFHRARARDQVSTRYVPVSDRDSTEDAV